MTKVGLHFLGAKFGCFDRTFSGEKYGTRDLTYMKEMKYLFVAYGKPGMLSGPIMSLLNASLC